MIDHCAINEQTADGCVVGRCWFKVENGICPRHGDVSEVQKRYAETGKLTLEENHIRKEPVKEKASWKQVYKWMSFWRD